MSCTHITDSSHLAAEYMATRSGPGTFFVGLGDGAGDMMTNLRNECSSAGLHGNMSAPSFGMHNV